MIMKEKFDFRYVQTWLWICLLKEKLTLDMSKYDLVCLKEKLDFRYSNMILSMFVEGKVDFRHVQIWLWVCLSKEKLTLDMNKYDKRKVDFRHVWI
jgi:hypothetical protein